MTNGQIPMKAYWMGKDIDELPREKLIEIIHHLNRQIENQRKTTQSIISIYRLAGERRVST